MPEEEEKIDIQAIQQEIKQIEAELVGVRTQMSELLKEINA